MMFLTCFYFQTRRKGSKNGKIYQMQEKVSTKILVFLPINSFLTLVRIIFLVCFFLNEQDVHVNCKYIYVYNEKA